MEKKRLQAKREKHTKETVRVREKQRLSERETLQESTGKCNCASNGELYTHEAMTRF